MSISERLLLLFVKKDRQALHVAPEDHGRNVASALSTLYRVISDFETKIFDKTILDFGCGLGYQAVAMAQEGAKRVVGVDINTKNIDQARELAESLNVEDLVTFHEHVDNGYAGVFDIVISHNSFEHFSNPLEILWLMKSALKKDGVLIITFGPPWFAPHGSHTQYFLSIPWVNLFFSEHTVMNVRKRFRNDGAQRYEDVEGGLNKMSVRRFERLVKQTGLEIAFKKYECIKGLHFFGCIPLLRELFINHITYELSNSL